jgi:EAL domain-containing protein (putative c-di-GMP-specific phosphodiesterase class I)/GGDEF domain-containing protein
MSDTIREFIDVLEKYQCLGVRIDTKKGFPVTVNKEYHHAFNNTKKPFTVNLADLLNLEDYNVILNRMDEFSVTGSGNLRVKCRFLPDGKRYYICCDFKREKRFSKVNDYLYGVIMDVNEFHNSRHSDPAEQELIKKNLENFTTGAGMGIADIVGIEQLSKMQIPLSFNPALKSGIFSPKRRFICSYDLTSISKSEFSVSDFGYSFEHEIKINHQTSAIWIIASDDLAVINTYREVHKVLAENLSNLANSYVMLFNEMNNTRHANKLLSETIEQQILLNSIYTKLLNERNSFSTMQSLVDLTGDFLKLGRILVCEDEPEKMQYKIVYEWISNPPLRESVLLNPTAAAFKYTDYPKLMEEFDTHDTYYSNNPAHDVFGLNFTSYVASKLNGDGSKYGVIIYLINDEKRFLGYAEKRLLRSVSQIIAAVIMRCKDNERMYDLAYKDSVLEIKNKSSLIKDINALITSGETGTAVAFRIINIKDISNYLGGKSDELISVMVDSIKNIPMFKEIKGEIYKYSDEIFLLLFKQADNDIIKTFCDKLKARFDKPFELESAEYHLQINAGIAQFPKAAQTAEELCQIAIMTMNKAAEYGANTYVFFSGDLNELETDVYSRAYILKKAVENDMEGLAVKYLPVHSAENDVVDIFDDEESGITGNVTSCEVLLAFEQETSQAEHGIHTSNIIMQTAEKMGLDVTVNSWLLKKACAFCAEIRRKGAKNFTVSVHATARSVYTGTIATTVGNIAREMGADFPKGGLAVQISERIAAVNYDRFIKVLTNLNKHGVSVILDDIGSYYNVMSLLRHTGISAVKADVSAFTSVIDEFNKIYIDNIMKLAKNNDINTIVKSVERREHLEEIPLADYYQSHAGTAYSSILDEKEIINLIFNQTKSLVS